MKRVSEPASIARTPHLGAAQALAANVAGVAMNLCLKLVALLPVSEIIVLRSLVAIVPLALLHAFGGRTKAAETWRRLPAVVWVRAGCDAAATLFVIIAVARASLALVTAITLTIPILVSLIGVFVFGERANRLVWLGVVLGLCGAVLVLQPTGNATPVGIAAASLAALCYAARDSVTLRMPVHYSPVFMALTSTVATLILGIVLAFEGGWRLPTFEERWLLAIAIGAYVLSNVLVTAAVRNAGLILSGVFRYATIPTAIAFDYLLFEVRPTPIAMAGMALVIASGIIVMIASAGLRKLARDEGSAR
jgi:drug/metabolite transporter (DMT)-like permease